MAASNKVTQGPHTLFVFDFDQTLINDNADTWIMSLCPELKQNLTSLRKTYTCWTDLMDHAFSLISKAGCTKEEVLGHIGQLRLYDQAVKAVHAVYECEGADSIILSDCNSVFIDHILEVGHLKHLFKEVFTNPAHFEPNGRLCVKWFHTHTCVTCTQSPNLCKGEVLTDYLIHHPSDRVVYVGDGRGDYCPSLGRRSQDIVICREGYRLSDLLTNNSKSIKAAVHTVDFLESLGDFIVENILP